MISFSCFIAERVNIELIFIRLEAENDLSLIEFAEETYLTLGIAWEISRMGISCPKRELL